jgi:tetratricopeptide (TPR) repeat protein
MKRSFVIAFFALLALGAQAQKPDKAKALLEKGKLADAKEQIDNALASDKFKDNADAWYLKAKIYLAISKDENLKSTLPDARQIVLTTLETYLKMEDENVKDESKKLLQLKLDNNAPLVDLYTGYSHDAATYFNAGNYNDAFTNFAKCLDVFDILASRKLITIEFDTTSTLYAGVSAEKAKKVDDAAKYYKKIADRKIKSEGFIDIYKWLANYYMEKNDIAEAQKYLKIGAELYPEDKFWSAYELDMLREKGTKEQLFDKYEEVLSKDPNNYEMLYNYGVEVYQEGYKSDVKERPANSAELIAKAADIMNRVLAIKPDYPNAQMVLGQIYYNQGVDKNNENKEIRPKDGKKLTPDELKKKDDLRNVMIEQFDKAAPYFIKVDDILDKEGKLKPQDREVLKNSLDLLLIIFEEKRNWLEQKRNKADLAKKKDEVAQYEKELKDLDAKNTAYTDKYNNVDKVH